MENKQVASNCPVSEPIFYPNNEMISFNGLAWSNLYGIVLQSQNIQQQQSNQWLGTQE